MMERISSGTELPLAFRMLEKLYGLGFNENITDEDIKRIAESNNLKIWNEGSARVSVMNNVTFKFYDGYRALYF